MGIIKKLENNQELRPDENILLDALANQSYANAIRQYDTSPGYKGGKGTVEMAGFIAELAATGGVGKLAVKGGEKALLKII